jgi:hypothetical protein
LISNQPAAWKSDMPSSPVHDIGMWTYDFTLRRAQIHRPRRTAWCGG